MELSEFYSVRCGGFLFYKQEQKERHQQEVRRKALDLLGIIRLMVDDLAVGKMRLEGRKK